MELTIPFLKKKKKGFQQIVARLQISVTGAFLV